jgi:hypothetical protein
MSTSIEPSCRIVATREAGSPLWSFYLINDGKTAIELAELAAVNYEWGDEYRGGESPAVRVINLVAGGQTLIWQDDGSSEMRTDLWIRITHRDQETILLFEFPKLYRQHGTTLVGHPTRMGALP